MTAEEILLALLQSTIPCPHVCNNLPPYTDTGSDIKSGLLISNYENVQGYIYTVSGDTPCTVEYIDKYGNNTTLNQTGGPSNICVKKVINNTCSTFIKGNACF